MKISFSTIPENTRVNVGYGYAGFNMVTALQRLGHTVPFQDPTAPVQIHFSQPSWYEFYPHQYKIGYTPWESSELPEGWLDDFNQLDELWTPSPLVAKWYVEAGVQVPIQVYEHGIPKEWSPRRRVQSGPIKFLHHGEPAPRKGGQMAFEAFIEVFGTSNDASLTIKCHNSSRIREYDKDHSIIGIPADRPNITVIDEMIGTNELIQLYYDHHALVYPGWGEGFGLIPLQAIGTGMPTICTGAWAPYERLILPELNLSSRIVPSPWPEIHPGMVFEPSYDDLVESYKAVANNYNSLAGRAYRNAFRTHEEYDWDNLTRDAFHHVVEKFS